jgi:hypothetical protein
MIPDRKKANKIYLLLSLLTASTISNASSNPDDDDYIPSHGSITQQKSFSNVFFPFNANSSLNRSNNEQDSAFVIDNDDDNDDDANSFPRTYLLPQTRNFYLQSILKNSNTHNTEIQSNTKHKKRVRFLEDTDKVLANSEHKTLHRKKKLDKTPRRGSFFTETDIAFSTPGGKTKNQNEDEMQDEDEQLNSYAKKASVKKLPTDG